MRKAPCGSRARRTFSIAMGVLLAGSVVLIVLSRGVAVRMGRRGVRLRGG